MDTMYNPCISVIIPIYNGGKYLHKCLENVLGQTLRNIEVICVDDSSTDNSLDILRHYAEKDNRIIIFSQDHKGSGLARNLALQNAKGTYVMFLDCDDFYPNQETLAHLYKKITENKTNICGGSFSWYINRQISVDFPDDMKQYIFNEEGLIKYSDYQFDFGYHRFIYNLSFLKENNIYFPDLKRFQDVPFFVKAMIIAEEFYAIPDVTYCYRKEEGRQLPVEWSSEKFRDVLIGITENLKMSKAASLERLHARCWHHFVSKHYYHALKTALYRRNYDTLDIAISLINEFDFSLLEYAGINDYSWVYTLREEIDSCLKKRDELFEFVQNIQKSEEIAVSVILPSLNVEPYIRLCIESIMKQTLINLEIICIDAGSNDGTLEVLNEYARVDSRIKIILSEKKSYGYQVNLGIGMARGQYIAIVETDDYISDNMYAELYEKACAESLEVIKGDFCRFVGDDKTRKMTYGPIISNREYYDQIFNGIEFMKKIPHEISNSMYIWAGLYCTEFIKKNNICCQETPGASFQDNGFWFTLLIKVQRMMFVHKQYYHLRRDNPNSSVMQKNKMFCMKQEYDFIREKINRMIDFEERERIVKIVSYYRFKNYIFTYNRLSELMRIEFLKMMQQEFLVLEEKGELDYSLFYKNEQKQLTRIMEDPIRYYEESTANIRQRIKELTQQRPQQNPKSRDQIVKNKTLIRKLVGKIGSGFLCWEREGLFNALKKTIRFVKRKIKVQ